MIREDKRSPLPFALLLTGAAIGAYLLIRKNQDKPIAQTVERISDACAKSLAKLEQRITAIAS